MAESVDALVSNTSGATRAGSTPALGTDWGEDSNLLPKTFFYLLQLLGLLTIGLVGDLGIWCAGRKKKGNP